MAKHTPGPWATIDGAEVYPESGPAAHVELARVVGPWSGSSWYGPAEAAANGRLIAAAPELLAALRQCADRLGEMDCGPELEAARAAIAKAEGAAR